MQEEENELNIDNCIICHQEINLDTEYYLQASENDESEEDAYICERCSHCTTCEPTMCCNMDCCRILHRQLCPQYVPYVRVEEICRRYCAGCTPHWYGKKK